MSKQAKTLEWTRSIVASLLLVGAFRLGGWRAALAVGVALVVVNWAVGRWNRRRLEGSARDVAAAPPECREALLEKLEPDDAAVVRLWLDEVKPAHQDPRAAEARIFNYPRASETSLRLTFLGCVGLSLLPTKFSSIRRSRGGRATTGLGGVCSAGPATYGADPLT